MPATASRIYAIVAALAATVAMVAAVLLRRCRKEGGRRVSRLRIAYVITEPRDKIDEEAREDQLYEARQLASASHGEVVSCHYTDSLPPADVVVLSGSSAPWSAHATSDLDRLAEVLAQAPQPVLGICAGLQLLVRSAGGRIAAMTNTPGEYGFCTIEVVQGGGLFAGLPPRVDVYQEHYDEVVEPPGACELLATSPVCPVQAVAWKTRPWWGTQFHPEWHDRVHPHGRRILENFFALARDALSGTQVRRGRADADA